MPVKIAVLKETRANERRVAMVPAVADKLDAFRQAQSDKIGESPEA